MRGLSSTVDGEAGKQGGLLQPMGGGAVLSSAGVNHGTTTWSVAVANVAGQEPCWRTMTRPGCEGNVQSLLQATAVDAGLGRFSLEEQPPDHRGAKCNLVGKRPWTN